MLQRHGASPEQACLTFARGTRGQHADGDNPCEMLKYAMWNQAGKTVAASGRSRREPLELRAKSLEVVAETVRSWGAARMDL